MSSLHLSHLANGLTIITDHVSGVHSVSLHLMVAVGSRYETQIVNGMSHFIEHMVFRGSKSFSALDIAEKIENVGGYINAHTSREETSFYIKLLREDLFLALNILSDMVLFPLFQPADIEKEIKVITQEIGECIDSPQEMVEDLFYQTAYTSQPFGENILGKTSTISSFNKDNVRTYHQQFYTPASMVLSIAGDVIHEEIVQWASSTFTMSAEKANIILSPASYHSGFNLVERDCEQLHIMLGFKGVSYLDPLSYIAQLAMMILGGGTSSRLYQFIREKQGLAYHIDAYSTSYSDTGMLTIVASTASPQAEQLLFSISKELQECRTTITPQELHRVKRQWISSLLINEENTSHRAEANAEYFAHYRSLRHLPSLINTIESITLEELQNFLVNSCNGAHLTCVAVGNKKHMPSWSTLQSLFHP